MRACNKCGAVKPLEDFHKDKSDLLGRCRGCKECANAKARAWNAANGDKKKATRQAYYSDAEMRAQKKANDKAWRNANVEVRRQSDREYAAANSERAVERVRLWRLANPDKVPAQRRADTARRRAQIKRACPAWADHDRIAEIYREADRLTRETGVPHDVDHKIPIAGRAVCGLHVHTNLRAISASENRRKSIKVVDEIFRQAVLDGIEMYKAQGASS